MFEFFADFNIFKRCGRMLTQPSLQVIGELCHGGRRPFGLLVFLGKSWPVSVQSSWGSMVFCNVRASSTESLSGFVSCKMVILIELTPLTVSLHH
jgi:hypothetical protein